MSRRVILLVVCIAAAGCGETPVDGDPPVAAAIEPIAGDGQSAVVDHELPEELVVRVTDAGGQPLPDITVQWVTERGAFSSSETQTDAGGQTSTRWHLGTIAGDQIARAAVAGLLDTAVFTAQAEPGPVAIIVALPRYQVLARGWAAAVRLLIQDAFGNTAGATPVTWTSSDPAVATVTNNRVDPLATGLATLTASVGSASTTMTVRIPAAGPFAAVAAGTYHTCALDPVGQAFCWGDGEFGQLGTTAIGDCGGEPCSTTPVAVATAERFRQITAGGRHVCALNTRGAAYCWGWDLFGQVGAGAAGETCGPAADRCSRTPLAVLGDLTFLTLSAGGTHTCGITTDLRAWCWGYGDSGRLGDAASLSRFIPVEVQGPQPFVEVEAGGAHTCGIGDRGLTYCWGFNGMGQLGDGTLISRNVPTRLQTNVRLTSFALGLDQTCATGVTDGGLFCWGFDDGNLGVEMAPLECDGSLLCVRAPSPVTDHPVFLTTSHGVAFRCGVAGTSAWCWGANGDGRLGNGSTTSSAVPVAVSGGHAFVHVTGRGNHACGLTDAGAAYCWGINYRGLLGNGTTAPSSIPVPVTNP